MFYQAVSQFARALKALEGWLDKAQQYADEKRFDAQALTTSRLAPDMKPFVFQVQTACDHAKGAAARLSGRTPPRHDDNEQTIDDLRARIRTTLAFIESVPESEYAGAEERTIRLPWAPEGKHLSAQDYLLRISIPNVYFHLTTAYAILRHNGVPIGKKDFLGEIRWIEP
jgi:hypothetical protein